MPQRKRSNPRRGARLYVPRGRRIKAKERTDLARSRPTIGPPAASAPAPSSIGFAVSADVSRYIATTPLPKAPQHATDKERGEWYQRHLRQREAKAHGLALDMIAWRLLEPRLSEHDKLVPLLPALRCLAAGFGQKWMKEQIAQDGVIAELRKDPKMQEETPLGHDKLGEVIGTIQNRRAAIERCWVKWCEAQPTANPGVERILKRMCSELAPLPVSPELKELFRAESQKAEARRVCCQIFKRYLHEKKNADTEDIGALSEELHEKNGLSWYRIEHVLARWLGLTRGQVRDRRRRRGSSNPLRGYHTL